jgi:hypothetical protein
MSPGPSEPTRRRQPAEENGGHEALFLDAARLLTKTIPTPMNYASTERSNRRKVRNGKAGNPGDFGSDFRRIS